MKSFKKKFLEWVKKKSSAVLFTKSQREEEDKPNLNHQTLSLECSETSETCYDSASSSESLIATVSSSKKRKVRNTSSESCDTCVASPDLRAEKKGNKKIENGDRQNTSPESQTNRKKDTKQKTDC